MNAPSNNEWGPALWRLLHTLSLRIETVSYNSNWQSANHIVNEEKRLWYGLLNCLKLSLPCPLCKKHYIAYFNSNPITLANINLSYIAEWIFNFHNAVNIRNNASAITIDKLPITYSDASNLRYSYNILHIHLKRAITLQWISRDDCNKLLRFLTELLIFYSI
jgi:hypothetical protein